MTPTALTGEVNWNPWHGCTKFSEGCRFCYVYRQDGQYGAAAASSLCRRTEAFDLPGRRKRDGSWKIPPGSLVYTCFTSDFLLKDADPWRGDCWDMIRSRPDCLFYFFTKRIERLEGLLPPDWGSGWENVMIGCTCEDQAAADRRMPVFARLPIRHKAVIIAPMLGPVDLSPWLPGDFEQVACSGESGVGVRPLRYEWVQDVRRQCVEQNVPFCFHQTGAYFVREGRAYRVPRRFQIAQARRAGIDYRIGADHRPEGAVFLGRPADPEQLRLPLSDPT